MERDEESALHAGDGPGLDALARAFRRRLDLERMFGWHPPLGRAGASFPAVSAGPLPSKEAPSGAASRKTPAEAVSSSGSPAPHSPPVVEVDPAERRRREALLEPLRKETASCSLCGLCRARTQAVFGVGDPCARLMFVGEAPGFDEDRKGEPFVGRAGKLLDRIIAAMGLRREDVYIANVVKCRPPGNRTPDLQESATCLPYLERQVEIIAPRVICALGAVAARSLLARTGSLGSMRGRFHDFRGIPVRVTYHPAYLLRNPAEKRKTWEDVQTVMQLLAS